MKHDTRPRTETDLKEWCARNIPEALHPLAARLLDQSDVDANHLAAVYDLGRKAEARKWADEVDQCTAQVEGLHDALVDKNTFYIEVKTSNAAPVICLVVLIAIELLRFFL